jgi:hypothetical protein
MSDEIPTQEVLKYGVLLQVLLFKSALEYAIRRSKK